MPSDRQADPGDDAFDGDPARGPRDLDPRAQPVDPVDQQHDIGRLGRGGGAPRAHGDAHIRRGQRGRIVDPVAHHHHRPVLALGEDQQNFLVRRQPGAQPVETEPLGHALGHVRAVAGGEQDASDPLTAQARPAWRPRLRAADRT